MVNLLIADTNYSSRISSVTKHLSKRLHAPVFMVFDLKDYSRFNIGTYLIVTFFEFLIIMKYTMRDLNSRPLARQTATLPMSPIGMPQLTSIKVGIMFEFEWSHHVKVK